MMLRRIVFEEEIDHQETDQCTGTETEVRDLTAAVDVMLGQVAARSPMHMKPIVAKLLPTARETTAKAELANLFYHHAEAATENVIATVLIVSVSVILTGPSAAVVKTQFRTTTARDAKGRMKERSSTGGEVTHVETSMSCLTETRDPVQAGAAGLTVMLKVPAAGGIPRFVSFLHSHSTT